MKIRSRLTLCIYKLFSCAAAPVFAVTLAIKRRRDPPYGTRIFELLGCYRQQKQHRSIWFHGASFGEINSVRPLLQALSYEHPQLTFIVSTYTTTGAKAAQGLIKNGINTVYAPLDAPYALYGFFKRFRPSCLFIIDTELWPNMLDAALKNHCQTCIINARIQEKNLRKYLKYPNIAKDLFGSKINSVLCSMKEDASRFQALGVKAENISVTGNLKYDLNLDANKFSYSRILKHHLGLNLVIGVFSAHEDECQTFINAYLKAKEQLNNLKMVIVPRHQAGVTQSVKILREIDNIFFIVKSAIKEFGKFNFNEDILIGDTMGEMELYFGLADLAIMGGSFDKVGGHNPLEPAFFGLPVITGPCFNNFKEQFNAMFLAKGAFLTQNQDELAEIIIKLMRNGEQRISSGLKAQEVQRQGQGALEKVKSHINAIINIKN